MYEDLYVKKAELEDALDDEGLGKERQALQTQYVSVCRALGEETETLQDPLVDQWEKDLAEGRMPDLDAAPS
jgi:hypothetical protein